MMTDDDKIQSVLGLDVSCDSVTLFDSLTGHPLTIGNTRDALHSALQAYGGRTDILAVCEATGGYEDQVLAVLMALGISAHRADAAKVKAYIRSFGKRAKTDAIDARWLAQYGLDRSQTLVRWQPPQASQSQVRLLSARRTDLVAMRVQEKNRLKAPRSAMIAADIEDHIAELDRRIALIEAQIETLIRDDTGLRRREKALRSVPGIGATIAALLIAAMPELGSINRRQAASLAGCAPHPRDSGKLNGYRAVCGGRRHLRPALFIAALTAIRGDNPLATAYKAFLSAGKPKRLALGAIMRKIITIANARIRDAQAAPDN
ncbi:IS110 family transposase [Pararhizobium sp.]|uniref:IS110 family transposase n=1 Tax=Pararhizobium sp. TaxID=1977563 RepID=UPI003D0B4340